MNFFQTIEKQPPEVFIKKYFLKISQNLQKSNCVLVFFNKALGLQLYLKSDSDTGVFLWILQNF